MATMERIDASDTQDSPADDEATVIAPLPLVVFQAEMDRLAAEFDDFECGLAPERKGSN